MGEIKPKQNQLKITFQLVFHLSKLHDFAIPYCTHPIICILVEFMSDF